MKLWFGVIAALLFCGCTVLEPVNVPDLPPERIGNEIVKAVQKGDYALFLRYSGEREKPEEREAFERSCARFRETYGEIRSFRYLTTLKTPLAVNQLYVVEMVRPGADGNPVMREMAFQLLLGKTDGKWRVLGMRFI